MRFDVIDICDLDDALATTWRRLQASDPDMTSAFWAPGFALAVAGARDDVRIGVIESGGRVTGILPFHRKPDGSGAPVGAQLSDYHGIIGAPPPAGKVSDMLRGFALASYDYIYALRSQPLFADNAYHAVSSPRADLGGGYDAWRDRVAASGSALKTLARKERKLARELGPLRFEPNDRSDAAWATFRGWKDRALCEQGSSGFLAVDWHQRLIEGLRDFDRDGCAGAFATLYAGDRLVAAHFGIRSGRALHWWFPSYDTALGKYSAGLVLLRHCAEAAAADGLEEIDFGFGTQRYKVEFSTAARELCEGSLERASHPVGALRSLRKLAQRQVGQLLPARGTEFLRRAGNRVLHAGTL